MCCTYRAGGGTMWSALHTANTQRHDECVDRLDALSCALVAAAASALMLESTGTRSIEPCAFSILATHAAVVHRTCRTK
eukprot:7385314-Prymnesium_polylepis.1